MARQSRLEKWASERLDLATNDELDACSLQQRQETKFVMPADRLSALIGELAPHYRAVRAGSSLAASYRTLYFDTPEFRCFRDGRVRLPHHKVRVRHYDDRRLTMLEVKTRTTEMRSLKFRQSKDYGNSEISDAERAFIATHLSFSPNDLVSQLWTNFCRVTLVGQVGERVTIDCDLRFRHAETDLHFSEVAVIEVKQERYKETTPIMKSLAAMNLRPMQVSKYGAAVALTGAAQARPRMACGTLAP